MVSDTACSVFSERVLPRAKPRYGSSQTNTIFETTSVGSSHFPDQIRLVLGWNQEAPGRVQANESNEGRAHVDELCPKLRRYPPKAGRNLERVCNLRGGAILCNCLSSRARRHCSGLCWWPGYSRALSLRCSALSTSRPRLT